MSKIKAIIFDLDGTLLHSIADIANANNEMLRSFNYPEYSLTEYIQWIGNGASLLVEKSLPQEVLKSEGVDKFLSMYKENYRKQLCNKSELYPGIKELLNYISEQELSLAINTNKPNVLTQTLVSHYFKAWDFKVVIGQSAKFPHKPDPTAAFHIAKSLNIAPEHTLFIGDSNVDMKTAIAANMLPLGVSWGYGTPNPNGTEEFTVLDNALDIIDYIKTNNETETK